MGDDRDLADGEGQLAVGHLVDLDRDIRTIIGDLLAEFGAADHSRDRWLASADAALGNGSSRTPA